MITFVAKSLQFVASCKGLVVATCNEAGLWRPLTYESPLQQAATNGLQKQPLRCSVFKFRCSPLHVSLQPLFQLFFARKAVSSDENEAATK
jgi:hypothetical protein